MTTFGSQIASHIASVVVTEFKVTFDKRPITWIFYPASLYIKKGKSKPKSLSLSAIDQNS